MKRGLAMVAVFIFTGFIFQAVPIAVNVCMADYTYVLNPSGMTVGQMMGENLIVKEGCPDPSATECSEKIKFVSATTGRLGRIEFPVSLSTDFDVSVSMDENALSSGTRLGESITLHTGGYVTSLKFTQDYTSSQDTTSLSSSNPKDTGGSGCSRINGAFGGGRGDTLLMIYG